MGDFIRTHRPFLKRSKRSHLAGSNTSLSFEKTDQSCNSREMGRKSIKEKDKRPSKRGSTKEKWLLTRKTWKYMTDAGRRLIPDGLSNKPEDVPKLENYFQDVCRNEPRFLIWRRKCSYPGALPTPNRRRRRLKKLHSPPKSGSADETEDDQKETCQQEEMMIDLLKRYLNISDEDVELFRSPVSTSSVGTSSTSTTSKSSSIPLQFVSVNPKPNISPHLPKISPTLQSIDESIRHLGNYTGTVPKTLLFDSLVKYTKTNRFSPLASVSQKLTPELLTNKTAMRQIYDELRQHQINRMLKRSTRFHHGHHQHPPLLGMHSLSNLSLFGRSIDNSVNRGRSAANASGNQSNIATLLNSNLTGIGSDFSNKSLNKIETGSGKDAEKYDASTFSVRGSDNKIVGYPRKKVFVCQGTQTDVIAVDTIKEISTKYQIKCEEEEKQRREEESYQQQQEIMQHQEAKSSRRRSSIENEDVSSSVSDTIKRYLRMARKKSSKKDDANRFKSINYDRNLRNIKSKGELSMPGDDDGNMKGCQTLENWIVTSYAHLTKEASICVTENKPTRPSTLPRWKTVPKGQVPSPNSMSSPSSPGATSGTSNTSLFHSSTQFLSNLLRHPHSSSGGSHSQENSNPDSDIAMQKSKSSSNVGHLVSKKIWKSRSKSQTRTSSPTKPQWTPQGNCVWTSGGGRQVLLTESKLHCLTEVERKILLQVAVDKINQFNIGVNVAIPNDLNDGTAPQKPQKRRALLLKRKAITTSFFDTAKGGFKNSSNESNSGQVFGISLEQCLDNDNRKNKLQKSNTTDKIPPGGPSGGSCESLPSSRGVLIYDTGILKSSQSQFDVRRGSQEDEDLHLVPPGLERSNGQQVPALLIACVQHLEKYGLHTIGIFRKSTSKKRVRQLREDFDHGNVTSLDPDVCPHDVATLMKEYLRDLKEPLLCRNLYQAFVNTQKIRNRRLQLEALSSMVQLLPVAHRDTLFYLLKFLAKVATFANDMPPSGDADLATTGNKMDSNNLATVFAPNILHNAIMGQATTDQEVDERIDVINVIRTMIDHYEELFRIPAQLMNDIYTNMIDTYPSQLNYLCDSLDLLNARQQLESELSDIGTMSPTSPPPTTIMTTAELIESQKQRRISFLQEHSSSSGVSNSTAGYARRQINQESAEQRRRSKELNTWFDSPANCIDDSSQNTLLKIRSSSIDSESPYYSNFDLHSSRRMSSPYELSNTGVLTASLKIPVQVQQQAHRSTIGPLNIGEELSDIPYIEDSGYADDRDGQSSSRSSRRGFSQMFLSSRDRSSRNSSFGTVTGTLSLVQSPTSTTSTSTSPDQIRSSLSNQVFFNDEDFQDSPQTLENISGAKTSASTSSDVRKLTMSTLNKKNFETKKPIKQKLSLAQPVSGTGQGSTIRNEPKFSTSISQIGGAVMRSKTADFERMLLNNKKTPSRSATEQIQSRTSQDGTAPPITDQQRDRRSGPIYKRRELISSVQTSSK